MKKLIFSYISLFALLLCYTLPSNAQQAFYIYRNDGGINTFITTEIDSMTYSRLDLDSVAHDNYVVHEVYTPDSIYRIPIELIDSVGFVTPETVYQPGVRVLEGEMRSYIISRNELTLMFQSSTPNSLLPHVGDKLVTTEIDDVITNAFVGQVSEVNTTSTGMEVVCEPVDLTEVFETYYGIIRKNDEPVSARRRSLSDGYFGTNGTRTLSPGKLPFDLLNTHQISVSYQADDNLSYSLDHAQATISLTPTVDYNAYLIVNKDYGTNISVTAIGNYTLEEYFALAGGITVGDDAPLFEKAIPIPEALIDVFFEFGIFANFKATLSTEQTWTQKYRHVFHWEWSSKGHETLKNTNDFKPVSNTHTGKVALNGTLSVGAYGKVGIAFIATSSLDIAQVDLRAEGGISLEGTYVPYKRDEEYAKKSTDLYNQIKEREVGVYWYYGLSAEAKLFKWSVSKQVPNFFNFPLNKKGKILGFRLVPLFSDTKLTKDETGTYYASTNIREDVFTTDVGFALLNQKNEEDATYSYSVYDYKGPKAEVYASFFDKPASNEYTVYPLVKYLGMELIAEPSAVVSTPLQFKEIKQDYTTYADDKVTVSMKTVIEVPSDEDMDLSSYKSYGVYVKNNITGREDYYSVQDNGSMEFWITLDIPRSEFETDYSLFTATCNKFLFATYTIDKDGKINRYDEQEPQIIYDQKPSLTFTNVQVGSPTAYPQYDDNGEFLYNYYSAALQFDFNVEGAFWMNYVQSFVYGGDWEDNEGPIEIVNDGTYSNPSDMGYPDGSDMYFTYSYHIYLNNGSSISSNNSVVFGGTPTSPSASIGGVPSHARSYKAPIAKQKVTEGIKMPVSTLLFCPRK